MSDRFIQQQRVEREQLRRLLVTMKPLLDRCRNETGVNRVKQLVEGGTQQP